MAYICKVDDDGIVAVWHLSLGKILDSHDI